MVTSVDDDLPSWSAMADDDWPTLLLGNGLSINLWSKFSYASLYAKATLSTEAAEVFSGLDTTNFETSLEAIHHARLVAGALGQDHSDVDALYDEVRDGLFEAVNDSHVPWGSVPLATEELLAKHLDARRAVFTTNYDLIPYWSHNQHLGSVNLVDFLWGADRTFDPDNTALHSSRSTPVYYNHGAVHLWQDQYGDNGKWTNADAGNLLAVRSRYRADRSRRPLFISEGTSKAKIRTIQRSPYLSFCLDALTEDGGNTVVFGHSLSVQDQHIVDALKAGPKREFAVSIYPSGNAGRVMAEKIRIEEALAGHRVRFFDSSTHPLGDPGLRIG